MWRTERYRGTFRTLKLSLLTLTQMQLYLQQRNYWIYLFLEQDVDFLVTNLTNKYSTFSCLNKSVVSSDKRVQKLTAKIWHVHDRLVGTLLFLHLCYFCCADLWKQFSKIFMYFRKWFHKILKQKCMYISREWFWWECSIGWVIRSCGQVNNNIGFLLINKETILLLQYFMIWLLKILKCFCNITFVNKAEAACRCYRIYYTVSLNCQIKIPPIWSR